ncbi:MAG: PIN domain-containing protein [Balneolaceae bacterium]
MKRLFIDSDVQLDIILKREPFYIYSARVLNLATQKQKVRLFTSAICFANLYYLLTVELRRSKARNVLKTFKTLFSIIPTSDLAINNALESDFKDLKDAFQYFTAIENNMEVIITRNTKDFKSSEIPVFTPKEFLATL